ncbi:MAG TPA: anti-sigma factor [Opitutaceae bacterium]|nr:anti-sigma factor [Opitutaceae bacterium]
MDEPNIAVPAWIPWATTAVLAALLACVGELWQLEKAKSQLLRDEASLSDSTLKDVQNRLEAEQIVSKRALGMLGGGINVEVLSFREKPSRTCGTVVWNTSSARGALVLFNLPKRPPGGAYQLWMLDVGIGKRAHPASCGVFEVPGPAGSFRTNIDIAAPGSEGLRFILVYGKKGGSQTLDEAAGRGSIVLASPGWDGKIANP